MEITNKIESKENVFYISVNNELYKLFDYEEAIMHFFPFLELSWEKFVSEYIKDSDLDNFLENVDFNVLLYFLHDRTAEYWFINLLGWCRDGKIPLSTQSCDILTNCLLTTRGRKVNRIFIDVLRGMRIS